MDENNPVEEEADTIYKSPMVEKDEIIATLLKEKEDLMLEKENLGKDLPNPSRKSHQSRV